MAHRFSLLIPVCAALALGACNIPPGGTMYAQGGAPPPGGGEFQGVQGEARARARASTTSNAAVAATWPRSSNA